MTERFRQLAARLEAIPLHPLSTNGPIIKATADCLALSLDAKDVDAKKVHLHDAQVLIDGLITRGGNDAHVKILKAMQITAVAAMEGRREPTDKELGLGQCFIATAAHATEYAPDVVRLREFRDTFLCRTASGRSLLRLYEFISPPIARALRHSELGRKAVRILLVHPSRLVADLLLMNHRKTG